MYIIDVTIYWILQYPYTNVLDTAVELWGYLSPYHVVILLVKFIVLTREIRLISTISPFQCIVLFEQQKTQPYCSRQLMDRTWILIRPTQLLIWLVSFIGCVLYAWPKVLTHTLTLVMSVSNGVWAVATLTFSRQHTNVFSISHNLLLLLSGLLIFRSHSSL